MPDDLYSEILLDHYRYPRNIGTLENPTVHADGKNPLCGDELELDVLFDGERLKEIRFKGRGCAIFMASASMMTEVMQGKTISEIKKWIKRFKEFLRNGKPPDDVDMGDMESLAGVAQLPVRVKCALLAWTTLEEGINQVIKK